MKTQFFGLVSLLLEPGLPPRIQLGSKAASELSLPVSKELRDALDAAIEYATTMKETQECLGAIKAELAELLDSGEHTKADLEDLLGRIRQWKDGL